MGRLLSTANLPILVNTNTTPAILRGQERFLGYVPFRFCLGYVAILWAWKDPLTMKIFMKPNFRYFEGFFCLVKEPFSYNTEHFTSIFGTNRKLQTWIIFICIPYQISIQQALLYGSWLVTRPLSDYAHSIGFFLASNSWRNFHLSWPGVTLQLTQVLTMNNSFDASPLMLRVFEATESILLFCFQTFWQ